MGFWSRLFKKSEEPVEVFHDELLGDLKWSDDSEAWEGKRNDVVFGLSYDYEKTPKVEVINYARKVVLDDDWYVTALNKAIEIVLRERPKNLHAEIRQLSIRNLCFFDHERLFIQFYVEDDEPWWFAEATNGEVEYVGLDT